MSWGQQYGGSGYVQTARQAGGFGGAAMGGHTTSSYSGEHAQNQFEAERKRQEILRELGYKGPGGQQIMGNVQIELGRLMADAERARLLGIEDVTNAMREGGALFSGIRAREQARMEYPIVQGMARAQEDAGRQLTQLMQMLADVERERMINESLLLGQEARNKTDAMMQMGQMQMQSWMG